MADEASMLIVTDGRAGYAASRTKTAPVKRSGYLVPSRLFGALEQAKQSSARFRPERIPGAAVAVADF